MGKNLLRDVKKEALRALKNASDPKSLEAFRIAYLGRKGKVPMFLRGIASLPLAERRKAGSAGNELRKLLQELAEKKSSELGKRPARGGEHRHFDVSRPGKHIGRGRVHILAKTLDAIQDIFAGMGFSAVDGPEAESEYYNFDALNIPADHPARDLHDTFWLKAQAAGEARTASDEAKKKFWPSLEMADPKKRLLLRTHTSPVQIRFMETHTPPFRIIVPGRCFRYEASDASHDIQFHQVEGLYVDKKVSVADFKGVLEVFFKKFFGGDTKMYLRPSYFPFVEPGFEMLVDCVLCKGRGCSVCGMSGYLEMGGAGMVHQNVFTNAGYVRNEWTGFAFGIGVERFAMLKHKIPDIRLFFGGDLRFIEQF